MTTKLEQAARQALRALEHHTEQTRPLASTNAAIGNLREALAEQAEPDVSCGIFCELADTVIAADREKNKCR